MKKQVISSLLLISMLAVSCGSGASGTNDTTASGASDTAQEQTTANPNDDDLPELDFEGESVKIFVGDVHAKTTFPTYMVEEADGDVVNDAIFKRNQTVSERLNVSLEWECVDFEYGTRSNYTNRIQNSIMSDDGAIELICGPGYYTTNMIQEDYFLDLNTVKYIDFEKPYWTKMYNDTATINGKIYSALGDFSLNKLMLSYVLYFNKELFDNSKIDYPYETVLAGDWTLDVMEKTIKDTYRDINGDSTPDKLDVYGFQSESNNMLWAFMDPCRVKVFDADSSGKMQFVMDNEHNANVVDRLNSFLNENPDAFHVGISDDSMVAFTEGLTYITPGNLKSTSNMRDLDFEYGILPYPKLDNSDDNYITRTSSAISVFLIPVTCKNTDKVGAVLEAMSSESAKTVLPAYYETALKVKYLNDDQSVQVLDIINSGISTQFVDMFSTVFSGYSEIFRTVLVNNEDSWTSKVAGIKAAAIEKLDALMEYYYN